MRNAVPSEQLNSELAFPRLAFSMQETADMLGLSYQTVWRLTQRGLLKSSSALRHKLFSREEIERFLRSTTK